MSSLSIPSKSLPISINNPFETKFSENNLRYVHPIYNQSIIIDSPKQNTPPNKNILKKVYNNYMKNINTCS